MLFIFEFLQNSRMRVNFCARWVLFEVVYVRFWSNVVDSIGGNENHLMNSHNDLVLGILPFAVKIDYYEPSSDLIYITFSNTTFRFRFPMFVPLIQMMAPKQSGSNFSTFEALDETRSRQRNQPVWYAKSLIRISGL